MKNNLIKKASLAGALSVLMASPGLAEAEDYYRETKGYRTEPIGDTPRYVRSLSRTQFEEFRDVDWLDVGLDFRARYEYRENDYRFWTQTDPATGGSTKKFRADPNDLLLMRTRAYLGVHDILDPLRFVVEFQDSRSYNDLYEKSTNDVDEFELLQGYGELYFKNALGFNRPISIRGGRQAFEILDRRLIAANEFRNTTNNFEGVRLRFGKKQNDWDLDTFALQPVERLKYNFDRPDEKTWIYGGVLSIRRWSDYFTVQPYFIGRKQNGDLANPVLSSRLADKDIYAPGLRVYGVVGDTGWDFDADINKQFGRNGVLKTDKKTGITTETMQQDSALAYDIEVGYSPDLAWKPRFSLFYGYGSGDKNPNDNINQTFDAFYGFNQPWSRNDYFSWDNIHAPKGRVQFSPYKDVKVEAGYNAYWLDSQTAAWQRANLQDKSGKSGSFLGHEFDVRLLHHLNPYVDWSMSYAYFSPGDFVRKQAKEPDGPFTSQPSNFFYFEVTLNAFGDGKIH